MTENSKIEWCDHTFNPWEGCTKVGPGCDNCYAEARNHRFGGGNWGPGAPRRRTSEANWNKPIRWNEEALPGAGRGEFVQCERCGRRELRKWDGSLPPGGLACCSNPDCTALPESESWPVRPRVFCASLADWLDKEVHIEWLMDLLQLIWQTPHLDWLLLTKRIGNCMQRLEAAHIYFYHGTEWPSELFDWMDDWLNGKPPHNVWIGATMVNQKEVDRDMPTLLEVPARVRFLSMEPLLGHVSLGLSRAPKEDDRQDLDGPIDRIITPVGSGINWVIAGGESGPNARPMHPDWARSLRDQCQAAGVPFFFKQWGEWRHWSDQDQTDYLYTRDMREMRFHGLAIHVDGTSHPEASKLPSHNEDSITQVYLVGKKVAGRSLDGRTWNEVPEAS